MSHYSRLSIDDEVVGAGSKVRCVPVRCHRAWMTTLMKQLYWPWLFSSPFSPSGSCQAAHHWRRTTKKEENHSDDRQVW